MAKKADQASPVQAGPAALDHREEAERFVHEFEAGAMAGQHRQQARRRGRRQDEAHRDVQFTTQRRQRGCEVAARVFEYFQLGQRACAMSLQGSAQQCVGHVVLDRAGRVLPLALGEDAGATARQAGDLDQFGVAEPVVERRQRRKPGVQRRGVEHLQALQVAGRLQRERAVA